MEVTAMKTIELPHSLVVTRHKLAEEYGVNVRTIDSRLKELEQETDRYGKHAVIRDGGICVVSYLAFADYMANRKRLKEKNLRKHVEPYNAEAVARTLGLYGAVVSG